MKRIVGAVTLILFTLIPCAQAASMTDVLIQQETRLNARIGMAVADTQGTPVFNLASG